MPIDRDTLAALSRKSNGLGALQTVGFLATLAITGCAAWYSSAHWAWYATLAALFIHGTVWAFLSNGFHELSHGSVFATRSFNRAFLAVFSFLGWNNPVLFWTSHTQHHKFALHLPDDQEVSPSARPTLGAYLLGAIVDPLGLCRTLRMTIRHARGRIEGDWEERLFPPSKPALRRQLTRWAWILLAGHAAIVALAVYFRLWMLPVIVTFAPFYGGAIQWLCNESQHTGLPGQVPDFRLSSRTIYLNPFLQFLYFHMNYHTEHHLFTVVPCYRLARLHRVIQEDMPPCPHGLIATWRQINATFERQKIDAAYEFLASVPPKRTRPPAR